MSDFRSQAVKEIEQQRDQLLAERLELNERRMKLLHRLRVVDQRISDLKAAARAFDLEVEFPTDEREEFEARRASVEREARLRAENALRVVGNTERILYQNFARVPRHTSEASNLPVGKAEVVAPTVEMPAPAPVPVTPPPRPPIREIVLQLLQTAGAQGMKAADIREYLERTYSLVVHEKTVGMTLYRLSKSDLVHREGFTWFFGPQTAETKNPGGDAPGPGIFG